MSGAAALDHGFGSRLIVLGVALLVGAGISAGLVRSAPRPVAEPAPQSNLELVKKAA